MFTASCAARFFLFDVRACRGPYQAGGVQYIQRWHEEATFRITSRMSFAFVSSVYVACRTPYTCTQLGRDTWLCDAEWYTRVWISVAIRSPDALYVVRLFPLRSAACCGQRASCRVSLKARLACWWLAGREAGTEIGRQAGEQRARIHRSLAGWLGSCLHRPRLMCFLAGSRSRVLRTKWGRPSCVMCVVEFLVCAQRGSPIREHLFVGLVRVGL